MCGDATQIIQQDFVTLRAQSKEIGPDILHYFLTLARLLGQSHLEDTMTPSRWADMRALDAKRTRQVALKK